MNLIVLIKAYLVLFGGGFCFVLALSQLFGQSRYPGRWLFIVSLFSLAIWEIINGIAKFSHDVPFPFNIYVITFPFFIVSVTTFYLLCRRILDATPSLRLRDAIHVVIPLCSFLVLLPYIGRPRDLRTMMNTAPFRVVFSGCIITGLGYFIVLLIKAVKLLASTEKSKRKPLLVTTGFIATNFLVFIVWFVDLIFSFGGVEYINIVFNVILILIFLFGARHPDYFLRISEQAERLKYTRSLITEIDTGKKLADLSSLMASEKLYRDPDLCLETLARRVHLSPQQLSELLNSKAGKTLLEFVDEYRIEEAKLLLLDDTGRKVIDIAFNVGFNSASAFYSSFKKYVGLTPTNYRAGKNP